MRNKLESGQSLVEVIVASVVGIFVVSALTFTTIFSLRNANFAKTSAQATKLAQEGVESVRTGRDRNRAITGLGGDPTSWDGSSSSTCSGSDAKSDSIWCYQIDSTCSNQLNPNCYFNVISKGDVTNIGVLNNLGNGSSIPTLAEQIPPNFRRVVILSDTAADYTTQKKVTVIVTWTDFAGSHESRLITILRKL
ncbi:MAG: hypothetical protein ACD_19C00167G0001 [uncultured bacterium]|uniref:Uncharacterized protein n=1 Tax=Candidatus Daviesbacteria bacterium RIFCSPHIGHO2_01_FULL_40_11 TaxID=1797762 RepID=A0A1F5JLQ3_9BACT|nr:MAG: hypothetical protein ACD_19C00167G0001 [uncultured bacterium]OGE29567.1 MAG: hypothetical protein A2867_00195 [Candidatus Daviesbacteria bacterium RIFCSPHIGHO2_01_FULL_40_11]OGE62578.1 MAG: hypothetical protein A2964_00085 [Candidatus Daviesbacteria bacterium RIFCSPLOWO2_01_FULL_40_27]